jgi:hypothetical protein
MSLTVQFIPEITVDTRMEVSGLCCVQTNCQERQDIREVDPESSRTLTATTVANRTCVSNPWSVKLVLRHPKGLDAQSLKTALVLSCITMSHGMTYYTVGLAGRDTTQVSAMPVRIDM